MITVTILINNNPIHTRSAVRMEDEDAVGKATYEVDDGSSIRHNPDEGAVALAKKMLDTIKEPGTKARRARRGKDEK